jgi:hypothetical protein
VKIESFFYEILNALLWWSMDQCIAALRCILNPLSPLLSISRQWFAVPIGVIMGAHDKFLCIHKK